MFLLLESNYINQLKKMKVKLQIRRKSYSTHNLQRLVAIVRISGKQSIETESATREQQKQVEKLATEKIIKHTRIYTVPEPPNNLTDIRQPQDVLSEERHSNTTLEDLSEPWGISVAQAALTLKATTQKLVQSAIMPLSSRYREDQIFNIKRLQCTIATDTMHAKVNSIHGDYYCQIFGNK